MAVDAPRAYACYEMARQCMKLSRKHSATLTLGFLIVLATPPLFHAQTSTPTPNDANATASPAPVGQAPDEATKKISDLVHAGKYAEAQKLTEGLLIAYPDDQRLIKAKVLIEQMLAPSGSTTAAPVSSQPAADANAAQLTGMDKVDYDTLILLARQARQATDLDEQKKLLQQFMDQSSAFLQKHPDQMLLWQLRAASAISLDEPMLGYEAGQKLLSAGAADSSEPDLRRLLAQLNGNGWLDKQKAEDDKKYGGVLGTWNISWSIGTAANENGSGDKEAFVKSDSGDIEGYFISVEGWKAPRPNIRGIINASGNISWEMYLRTTKMDPYLLGGHNFIVNDVPGKQLYPSGWQPPVVYVRSDDKRTMTMKFSQQTPNIKRDSGYVAEHPVTWTFEKVGD